MAGRGKPQGGDAWRRAIAGVTPLRKGQQRPAEPPAAPHSPHPAPHRGRSGGGSQPALRQSPFDPGLFRKLSAGKIAVDFTVDLHGLTEDEAYRLLLRRLEAARVHGKRRVVVITGKGRGGEGALRRALPRWLESPRFVPVVSAFTQAHARHGGEGAFYVLIRKSREWEE